MTATERILPRLTGVRRTSNDRWTARCPAHDDRSPSLSGRQVSDRLLLRCWAGCTVEQIVTTIGLTLADLYDSVHKTYKPDPIVDRQRRAVEGLENWRQAELRGCA